MPACVVEWDSIDLEYVMNEEITRSVIVALIIML